MQQLLKQVSALLLSYGCLLIGSGLFMTLLSLRSSLEGFSTSTTGLIMSGYYLGIFLGARCSASLVSRVGYIRTFSVLASIISITPLVHMLWVEPMAWFVFRMITGFAMAGLIMVTESWLNTGVDNQQRGSLLGIYMVINYLGAGAAQLLLLVHDVSGYQLFVMSSICFSLCLVPVALTHHAEPIPEGGQAMKILPTLKRTPVGFFCAMCAGFLGASFNSIGPIFALKIGLSNEQIVWFMALGICGGLVLQSPIGKLSDRIDRRKVIALVATLVVFSCLLMRWQVMHSSSLFALLAGSFLYGSLAFTLYSLAAAHANDWAGNGTRMQTAGALLVAYSIGAVIGPMLSASAMSYVGPIGLFDLLALGASVLVLFSVSQIVGLRRYRPRSKKQFVPRPGSYYTSGEIYRAVQAESEPVEDQVEDAVQPMKK
ncbi:MAG: MFS family permease [Oceanospirillaceae bacterium]